jgi:hypothetical protein
VVDEHVAAAVLDLPRHRDAVGVRRPDQLPGAADELPDDLVAPPRLDGHVDLHAGRAARLRIAPKPDAVEDDLYVSRDREHVVVRDRFERIEVEEEVIGVLDAPAPRMERMELDAPEVDDEQEGREVLHHEVVDDAGLRVAAQDGATRDPLRGVRRRRLLVEELTVHAVRHPLHRQRAFREVGEDQLRGVVVIGEEVALRVALLGPEHLVQVGEAQLPAAGLEPPVLAAALRRERLRERHRERLGGLLPCGHAGMVAVSVGSTRLADNPR